MKVLHLIYSMERGGAEMDLLAKAAVLVRDHGVEEEIAVMVKRGDLAETAIEKGISVHELGMSGKTDLGAVARLRDLVREFRPDILHTHLFNAGLMGRMACGFDRKLSVISTVQAIRPDRSSWQVRADHYLSHATYKVIASSRATRDYLVEEGLSPGKVVAIHNCVDFSRFDDKDPASRERIRREWGIAPETPLVGCVSRLDPDKDLPMLVESFRIILGGLPEARLVIVGEGRERSMIEERIRQLGLTGRILLAGERSDVPDCLSAFDLFVLSSVTESFGIVLVEALAMRRPVVATRVGGIPEVVDDGETGLLISARSPEEMAGAVLRLLRDPERARQMAWEGSRRVRERFSAERLARRQLALYQRALKRREFRNA